jgi:hypothetical protein
VTLQGKDGEQKLRLLGKVAVLEKSLPNKTTSDNWFNLLLQGTNTKLSEAVVKKTINLIKQTFSRMGSQARD